MTINLYCGFAFLLITFSLCLYNNAWIKSTSNLEIAVSSKTPKLWSFYGCLIFWVCLIIIDIYSCYMFYLKDFGYYSIIAFCWNLIIIIAVIICHMHSGLFLNDAFLTLYSKRNTSIQNEPITNGPFISILIPSCNETVSILKPTIESLKKQNFQPYEIILVENS
jgi:hypothetical protein